MARVITEMNPKPMKLKFEKVKLYSFSFLRYRLDFWEN